MYSTGTLMVGPSEFSPTWQKANHSAKEGTLCRGQEEQEQRVGEAALGGY